MKSLNRTRRGKPKVFWSVKGHRTLEIGLAEMQAGAFQGGKKAESKRSSDLLIRTVHQLNKLLQLTFSNAEAVVVEERMFGFRNKADQFTLLVEVFRSEIPGRFVAKIGPEEILARELDACSSVRRREAVHDQVLLSLSEGCRMELEGKRMMTLVYGDAQQYIGEEIMVTLEAAVLQCVRFGVPSTESVKHVLVEVFQRLGHVLYAHCYVDDPANREDYVFAVRHLAEAMQKWNDDSRLFAVRRDANPVKRGPCWFTDPVDYLRRIRDDVPWSDDPKPEELVRCPGPTDSTATSGGDTAPPRPTVAQVIPRMLRGRAHGDLHGRNVLVGIAHDKAIWPAVFDYEDVGRDNRIGWDFVKLEMELKVRAFPHIFGPGRIGRPGPTNYGIETAFVSGVQEFEIALDEETETCHRLDDWTGRRNDEGLPTVCRGAADAASCPRIWETDRPADRLRTLLMELRRMAFVYLGQAPKRPKDWLEEYYFLLVCYGVYMARFDNLQHLECVGAFLSSGVAASRLTWARTSLEWEMEHFGVHGPLSS